MNILAPVNSLIAAEKMISAGAKEIYLGVDDCVFDTYSFTGRGKVSNCGSKVVLEFDALGELVAYAHENNVRVNFIANTPYMHNGQLENTSLENAYLNYVENGLRVGIDSVVIGDIGLLYRVSKQNYNVELHASVYLKTLNSYQLLLLSKLGVTRVCLSYHVVLDEIESLVQQNIMDVEVVGYLGCSFFNGACGFLHELGEGRYDGFDPGVACKNVYEITGGLCNRRVKFDVERGCAICSLGNLNKIGVKALKIVGRDRGCDQTEQIVRLYAMMLKAHEDGTYSDKLRDEVLPLWWKRVWCSGRRCKYLNTELSKYVIG